MTQTVKSLQGDRLIARDGAIGSVEDVYFDDERWGVRYLVVDTGDWLPGRRVLISPASVEPGGASAQALRVELTREQVKSAPPVDSDRPVSRQYEIAHAAHFGYPYYWSGPMLWGAAGVPLAGTPPHPAMSPRRADAERAAQAEVGKGDCHLRSGAEVIGYDIETPDGPLGEVSDFAVDERTWAIRDVVVDTTKWWPGGEVRVAPQEVERIDWNEGKVHLRIGREALRARR
jgi:sporulation protein YlmC with PRC-barrel domain